MPLSEHLFLHRMYCKPMPSPGAWPLYGPVAWSPSLVHDGLTDVTPGFQRLPHGRIEVRGWLGGGGGGLGRVLSVQRKFFGHKNCFQIIIVPPFSSLEPAPTLTDKFLCAPLTLFQQVSVVPTPKTTIKITSSQRSYRVSFISFPFNR